MCDLESAFDDALPPTVRQRIAGAFTASIEGRLAGTVAGSASPAHVLADVVQQLVARAPSAPLLQPVPLSHWLRASLAHDAPELARGPGGVALVERWVVAYNERLAQLAQMVAAGAAPPCAPPPHLAPGFSGPSAAARSALLARMLLPPVGPLIEPVPPALPAAEAVRLYLAGLQRPGASSEDAIITTEAAAVSLQRGGGDDVAVAAIADLCELLANRLQGVGAVLVPSLQAAGLRALPAAVARTVPQAASSVAPVLEGAAPAIVTSAPRRSYSAVVAGSGLQAPSSVGTSSALQRLPQQVAAQQQQQRLVQWQQLMDARNVLPSLPACVPSGSGIHGRATPGAAAALLSNAEAAMAQAKQLLLFANQHLHTSRV